MLFAAWNNFQKDHAPYVVMMIIAVMSFGTLLFGLVTGSFPLNSFGTTNVIRRRESPLEFWGVFLLLVIAGGAASAVAVPVLFFGQP